MTKKNSTVDNGIPRPYANKKLPTPKALLREFLNPVPVWFGLVILLSIFAVINYSLVSQLNVSYNLYIISLSLIVSLKAIGLNFIDIPEKIVNEVPSINTVSNTIEYIRASSRLFVLTIISGIATNLFLIITHSSDFFYFIDVSTRVAIIGIMMISYVMSYIIIQTLCSYSSVYKNSNISIPVEISSVPEFVTLIGFIIPPILVITTGMLYNGPPLIDIPFYISLVDTVSILVSIQALYIAVINKF